MIPIIEAEVVDKNKWIEKEEFLDLIAIAQSCPGVFAVNVSIFIGYKMRKLRGALCTCVGTALITLSTLWIPVVCALLIWAMGVNPIYIIIGAGLCGFLYGQFIKPTEGSHNEN